tara:strand:+ start:94 stop:453 length:360 start_codon:yes stop_codon:yes gene_type:complete
MILQGPKLEMKQLTLARLVDVGTELAVCGLVLSRVDTEVKTGTDHNLLTAEYWVKTRLKHIDKLFKEVWSNNDNDAKILAAEQMIRAEYLPDVDTSHLKAIETDTGRDITNGVKRKDEK